MIYYVCHKNERTDDIDRAQKVTRYLQIHDTDNCYICPVIAFSHLRVAKLDIETEMLIHEDLLEVCDAVIVASELSPNVRREIALARRLNMEVEYLEDRT